MCLPALAIAGIATSLLGGGLQFLGQRKADKAANATFNRERSRQKSFEKEQVGKFEDSLASTRELQDPAAQAAAAAKREGELAEAAKSADPKVSGYLPGSSSAPSVVATAAEKAGAASDARTSQLAKSLAALGGTADQLQQNDIRIGRNSQEIDQLRYFKRNSLELLPHEMEAAKQKGSKLRTLGGLVQTFGSFMSARPGSGVGAPLPIDVLKQGSLVGPFNPAQAFAGSI